MCYEITMSGERKKDFETTPACINGSSSTLKNLMSFHHSFGYSCSKYPNLCVLNDCTIAYFSGNVIHLFNLNTKEINVLLIPKDMGIGHITKNPNLPHIAVGETSGNPCVTIYEVPTMNIISELKGRTSNGYTCICYSPEGTYLCAQEREPDFYITVWNWKEERKLCQKKSYGQLVHRVMFSPYMPGCLISCGSALLRYSHIKFWTLSKTFTGLKLNGTLGWFDETDVSDILCFTPAPDDLVISGCEWGNMLIWSGEVIKAEVCGKNKEPCHQCCISHISYSCQHDQIITCGTDGFIKIWDFQMMQKAAQFLEKQLIELEPIHCVKVGDNETKALLLHLEKRSSCSDDTSWIAQDGGGSLWLVDLHKDHPTSHEKLLVCHSGPVVSIAASPNDSYFATLGSDGKIIFYNYKEKKSILKYQIPAEGGFMIWPNLKAQSIGTTLIVGCCSGSLRVVAVALKEKENENGDDTDYVRLIQLTKPHTAKITYIATNELGNVLVSGSEDNTVFMYHIEQSKNFIKLLPVGFVKLLSPVVHLTWKPMTHYTLLISCHGEAVEMDLPEQFEMDTSVSYELKDISMRTIGLEQIEVQGLKPHLMKETGRYKTGASSPQAILSKISSSILFSFYSKPDAVWLSCGGCRAGYLYEFIFDSKDFVLKTFIEMPRSRDVEIHSHLYISVHRFLVFGMGNGRIRIHHLKENDSHDLDDYWDLPIHGLECSIIHQISISYDKMFLFTCGHDGSVFSFTISSEFEDSSGVLPKPPQVPLPQEGLEDSKYPPNLSLEQQKIKEERDHKMFLASEHKSKVLKELQSLREEYSQLLKMNEDLPASQRVPLNEFVIDHRISEDLNSKLRAKLEHEKNKWLYDTEKSKMRLKKVWNYFYGDLESHFFYVYAIGNPQNFVHTFRNKILAQDFLDIKAKVKERLEAASQKEELLDDVRRKAQKIPKLKERVSEEKHIERVPRWLKQIDLTAPEFCKNTILCRAVEKYAAFQKTSLERKQKWAELMRNKPDPDPSDPEDNAAIENAERTIGDYKLKCSPDYHVPREHYITTDKKHFQILSTREKIYEMKFQYNKKVHELRNKKIDLIKQLTDLRNKLEYKHAQLPSDMRKDAPHFASLDMANEYPEMEIKLRGDGVLAECLETDHKSTEDMINQKSSTDRSGENGTLLDCLQEHKSKDSDNDEYPCLPSLSTEDYADFSSSASFVADDCDEILMQLSASDEQNALPDSGESENDDSKDTSWEKEMKFMRIQRALHDQDRIIKEMKKKIAAFDSELLQIKDLYSGVAVETKFCDLYLLKCIHELTILKEHQAEEDIALSKLTDKVFERHKLQTKILDMQSTLEELETELQQLKERKEHLLYQLSEATEDNEFSKYFMKVFKKYKPPRDERQDSKDSESSSCSSSESNSLDEEEEDENLRLPEKPKLSIKVCPQEVDKKLYELTVLLSTERYHIDMKCAELRNLTEILKKDMEREVKKISQTEKYLSECQEEWDSFQKEKHYKLNNIECIIPLEASRIYCFGDVDEDSTSFKNMLLFSKQELARLMNQISVLKTEAENENKKFRNYKTHLSRLGTDCEHMNDVILSLKKEIKAAMVRKFGCEVSIKKLKEAVLQQLIAEVRLSFQNTGTEFNQEIRHLKKEIKAKKAELSSLYTLNTEKMNLLSVLLEEKRNLELELEKQESDKGAMSDDFMRQYTAEQGKLTKIVKKQKGQIEALQREIKLLSFKGNPLPPISSSPCASDTEKEAKTTVLKPDVFDGKGKKGRGRHICSFAQGELLEELEFEYIPSMEEMTEFPTPESILEGLIQRIHVDPNKQHSLQNVLDDEIRKLFNRLPETENSALVINELSKLLSARTVSAGDAEPVRHVLIDMICNLSTVSREPVNTQEILNSLFQTIRMQEVPKDHLIAIRAITYDALRKCLGFILGTKGCLHSDDSLLQLLSNLNDENEDTVLIEDIICRLLTEVNKLSNQRKAQNILEEVVNDIETLFPETGTKSLFGYIFDKIKSQNYSMADTSIVQNILYNTLKKTLGITRRSENELQLFEVDEAILQLFQHVPSMQNTLQIANNIVTQVELRRECRILSPAETLVYNAVQDIASQELSTISELSHCVHRTLKSITSCESSKRDIFRAKVLLLSTVTEAIDATVPGMNKQQILQSLHPAITILLMWDNLLQHETNLLERVIAIFNEEIENQSISDKVQINRVFLNLDEVHNTFVDFLDNLQHGDATQYHSVTSLLRDILTNAIGTVFPAAESDEDVVRSEQAILYTLEQICQVKAGELFFQEFPKYLAENMDIGGSSSHIAHLLDNVCGLLQGLSNESKDIVPVFLNLFAELSSADVQKSEILQVLLNLNLTLKNAIKIFIPGLQIMDEEQLVHHDQPSLSASDEVLMEESNT